ncbi:MAG: PA2779 family protein [Pseudohongiella sp.]|nr:PA2779 family protein [Pseudohongiella sp.]MDO9521973.1 PA2779 family protein [Pseudohongiella sp.]MDP2128608.1 PA2779 family protein [Pseudohongiella sp.]
MKSLLFKTGSVWMMAVAMITGAVLQPSAYAAPAGMVSTQQLVQESRVDQQRAYVNDFLSRSDVQAQLEARGVDVADAQLRIAGLTGAELATLSSQIDVLPAGEGVLETVLFILVIFMLLDIAGVTDIFPGL